MLSPLYAGACIAYNLAAWTLVDTSLQRHYKLFFICQPEWRFYSFFIAFEMFDPLVTTATELRQRLEDGKITSVQIVQEYLAQIDRYNSKLNAFISIAPRDKVIRAAAALDQERRCGIIKSPLHGIPIVLKVILSRSFNLGRLANNRARIVLSQPRVLV